MKKIISIMIMFVLLISISYASNDVFKMNKNIGDKFNVDIAIKNTVSEYKKHTFKWTASNYEVLEIMPNGSVTCLKDGVSQLVGYDDLEDKTVYVNIVVKNQIGKISIGDKTLELPVDYKIKLEKALYYNFEEKLNSEKIFWSSSNELVATIDNEGNVKTLRDGETYIIAMSNDGSKHDYTKLVVKGNDIDVDVEYENTMYVGETQRLKMSQNKEYKSVYNYNLVSTNDDVVGIGRDGEMTAKSFGVAYINIMNSENTYKVLPIRVLPSITSIEVADKEMSIKIKRYTPKIDYKVNYKSDELKALNPNDDIKFESSAPYIAYVTREGEIIPRRSGVTMITVSANDGYTKKEIKLTVDIKVSDSVVHKFRFKNIPDKIYVGEIMKLEWDVNSVFSEPEFKFMISEGSNRQIYDVNGEYYFKPESQGVVDLEVKGPNGFSYKYPILVSTKLSKIDMNSGNYTKESGGYRIYKGQKLVLEPNFIPNGKNIERDILVKDIELKYDNEVITLIDEDKNIIKLDVLDDSYIRIITTDSKKEYGTTLYAKSSIRSSKLVQNQVYSVNEVVKPAVNHTYIHGLTHAYDENYTIEILSQYIPTVVLEDEIKKTEELITEIGLRDDYNKTYINRLRTRKITLSRMLKNSSGGYSVVSGNLYSLDGRILNVASVYDDYIVGNMKGKVKIQIRFSDNNKTIFGNIEFK